MFHQRNLNVKNLVQFIMEEVFMRNEGRQINKIMPLIHFPA